ncbi:FIG01018917: hypothetical protein [hydrothermal vent metagenome]|uniref:DUF1684 domain-containing protein n=1 Tax=hydrothermal vent metagenome TaxID=652676 RepID=A0A3B0UAA0_9ZZZZ
MKKIFFILSVVFLFINCSPKKISYEDEIKLFQYKLNTEFADAEKSPLTEEDLKTFKTLDFFKTDKNYKVEAEFELTPNTPVFEMQTNTDRLPLYRKYGVAHFTLNGEKFKLNIYQSQDLIVNPEFEDYLFLPFNDTTNGNSTYGGGRYIDLKFPPKESKTIVIDFNKAYNPYCAYNSKYSCPIPPSENTLSIDIPVGVKAYKKLKSPV